MGLLRARAGFHWSTEMRYWHQLRKGFTPCVVSSMPAGVRPRHSGTSCARLLSGLWSGLGGARYEDERLWLDKNDCPGWWGRSTWEKRGNPQWVVRVAFPTSRYQVAGCLARHGCLRDVEVFPSGQRWSQESPTSRYLPSGLLLGMHACCGLGDEAGVRLCLQWAVLTKGCAWRVSTQCCEPARGGLAR